jgi:hypothetical protein
VAAGAAAAAAVLLARTGDGRYVTLTLPAGDEPGEWRPELPAFVSDPFAWVGTVDPFAMRSPDQFQSNGPYPLQSGAYARDYNEVKTFGAIDSVLSDHQQAVAHFFQVSPQELFNRMFGVLSVQEDLSIVEDARLFGMLNLAAADSAIGCWNDKNHFLFWRPITAIHEGDDDGNSRTEGDADWMPLLPTPPYSDHVSGYNCLTGAMMNAGREYFRTDHMDFTLVRLAPPAAPVERDYDRFTDVIDDTIDARIFQGLHFRSADIEGARLGRDVARWVARNFFGPAR